MNQFCCRSNIMNFFLFFVIYFSVEAATVPLDSESDTLVLLHVLFRHGNRTPDRTSLYPKDPHLNETFKPFGYSQLTTKGKQTEYAIGTYLREKYGNFIPDQYTPDVVYSISTNFKRTKMSLELVLAGLFPPLESDLFSDLKWQPIPFNVEEDEQLIAVPVAACTNYVRDYYRYILSKEGQNIMSDYKELFQKLSEITGLDISSPDELISIYETLECERDYGLELPDWTSEYFPEILEEAAALFIEFGTATPSLKRLTTGRLLKKILDDGLAKQQGLLSEERKISLYSAHDFTVGAVLRSLNVYYRHIPPFGATIFFEIHDIDGVFGLKLYYQDYSETNPQLLTIPGCSSFCELDKLAELIADNLPGPYDVCIYSGELL